MTNLLTQDVAPRSRRLPHNFFDDAMPFKIEGVYCKLIPLTQEQFAIVDASDYGGLSTFKWIAIWKKGTRSFYARRTTLGSHDTRKTIYMHRQILGLSDDNPLLGDHREPSRTLDNRRNNLRTANEEENQHNMRLARNNTSGCKGVVRLPGNKGYQVQIRKKGMPRRIGKFLTYEAAVDAAVTAIKERHGEFARPEIKRKEEAA